MRAYHPAGLALAALLLAGPAAAQTLDPELTRAAQCAGIIKGASSVGFALGAEESAVETDFYIANIYLFGASKKAMGSDPDVNEFLVYEEIHSSMIDEVIGLYNAGQWGLQSLSDVIICYAEASTFFIDELPSYGVNEDKIRKASADQVANVKILFGLD